METAWSWVYIVGGAHFHGAEFEDLKVGLVQSHALLAKENGAWVIDFNGNCKNQVQGRQDDHAAAGEQNIQYPFPKLSIQADSFFLFVSKLRKGSITAFSKD